MSLIKINNIWKHYDNAVVLERLNARVDQGEFITIVGTSGCGKTTFLKMMLGIEHASSGQILLNDKPIPSEPGPDRGIVFQRYSVFPHLSVLNNLTIVKEVEQSPILGRLYGLARHQAQEEAMEMLKLVGLEHVADRYPHQLSGGMQQRLAIAQALMKQPRVLLLDEPFGALDPGIRKEMHKLILSIWRKTKINIFMITHDIREGFYLGTRLWVFDKVRHDPQAPHRYGSTLTYDLAVGQVDSETYNEIEDSLAPSRMAAM